MCAVREMFSQCLISFFFDCLFAREQVMSGREWCTLEEWLQCRRPLCPLVVRHDGRVEHTSPSGRSPAAEPPVGIRVCFASRRVGGSFLDDGDSQVRRRRQRQKLNSTVYLYNVTKCGISLSELAVGCAADWPLQKRKLSFFLSPAVVLYNSVPNDSVSIPRFIHITQEGGQCGWLCFCSRQCLRASPSLFMKW